MKKALITDYVHPKMISGLESLGFEVDYHKDIDLVQVAKIIHKYHGIIINSKVLMDKEMIDRARNLEFIGRLGSGLEIIDLTEAKEKDIQVYNSPEGNRNAVAEHAMGMLLSLANNLIKSDREVRQFVWKREENRGFELKGKTIGIIGFGNTGSTLATKLSSWELDVMCYDKYRKQYDDKHRFVKKASLEEIQNKAEIISLHLPLSKETFHLVDADFISKCKDGVIIVNTSRGKVINMKDFIPSLESGKIRGACLDVFENEKPSTYTISEKHQYETLFRMPNVVLSPHIAGWTYESLEKIATTLVNKIKDGMT